MATRGPGHGKERATVEAPPFGILLLPNLQRKSLTTGSLGSRHSAIYFQDQGTTLPKRVLGPDRVSGVNPTLWLLLDWIWLF